MMCYKDMTFCSYYKECQNGENCFRALTDEVKEGARYTDLYISQFSEKPECFKKKGGRR